MCPKVVVNAEGEKKGSTTTQSWSFSGLYTHCNLSVCLRALLRADQINTSDHSVSNEELIFFNNKVATLSRKVSIEVSK